MRSLHVKSFFFPLSPIPAASTIAESLFVKYMYSLYKNQAITAKPPPRKPSVTPSEGGMAFAVPPPPRRANRVDTVSTRELTPLTPDSCCPEERDWIMSTGAAFSSRAVGTLRMSSIRFSVGNAAVGLPAWGTNA